MEITTTIADKNKIKELCYISVTVKNSPNAGEIRGLFIGLRPLVENKDVGNNRNIDISDDYLWLMRGNCVHLFNLDVYDITHIDIGFGEKCAHYVQKSFERTEQNKAVIELENITNLLKEEGKLKESNIVSPTEIYTNIPAAVAKSMDLKSKESNTVEDTKKTTNKSQSVPVTRSGAVNYSGAGYVNTNTVTTAIIERTTTYDKSKAIARMRAKIKAIKNGTYTAPKLKDLPDDDDNVSGVQSTINQKVGVGVRDNWRDFGDYQGYGILH